MGCLFSFLTPAAFLTPAVFLTPAPAEAAPLPAPKPEKAGLDKLQGTWRIKSLSVGRTRGKSQSFARSRRPPSGLYAVETP
ncbi:MAG: hypothetical protein SNJ75_14340, partial [Gemmataceae bacterium]